MRTQPWGVTYGDNKVYFYGRRLLNYETFPHIIYNLATGGVSFMKSVNEYYKREYEAVPKLNVEEKR